MKELIVLGRNEADGGRGLLRGKGVSNLRLGNAVQLRELNQSDCDNEGCLTQITFMELLLMFGIDHQSTQRSSNSHHPAPLSPTTPLPSWRMAFPIWLSSLAASDIGLTSWIGRQTEKITKCWQTAIIFKLPPICYVICTIYRVTYPTPPLPLPPLPLPASTADTHTHVGQIPFPHTLCVLCT